MAKGLSPELSTLFRSLLVADMQRRLPGSDPSKIDEISEEDLARLMSAASVLALSKDADERNTAYEIATRVPALRTGLSPTLMRASDLLLARLGNFPGRQLLRSRYAESLSQAPAPSLMELESLAREIENTVEDRVSREKPLTDFQVETLEAFAEQSSMSVSAPTSAGKSFVLSLEVIRRLQKQTKPSVVYLVPTRALIRQVVITLRHDLNRAGLNDVPVRAIPMPIEPARAPKGVVYVLTQERLLSLLHSDDGQAWITTLIVDEAQGIGDGARGILLQTAVDSVVTTFPSVEVFFASPLARNPEYLLKLFGRQGISFLERHSPVSQNLILVRRGNSAASASFELILDGERVDLGQRDIGFSFLAAGVLPRRARFASVINERRACCIVYANGARDAERIAEELAKEIAPPVHLDPKITEFMTFLGEQVHKEYGLIEVLKKEIGFHYSNMPGSVRSGIEELCARNKLKFICCTSTLLQGVNLPARDIVIENPKRGMGKPMRRADFVNLAGRAGRLLREFHGNVWCLRPEGWEEASFEGEPLQEIGSAFAKSLQDGGTAIRQALDNDPDLDEQERNTAVAALNRVYTEFTLPGRSLAESEYKTAENENSLIETAQRLSRVETNLPHDLFARNYGVLPMRLESLYQSMRNSEDPRKLIPIAPFLPGTNGRLFEIFHMVERELQQDSTNRYRYYWRLGKQWIHQRQLHEIIAERITFLRSGGEEVNVRNTIYEVIEDVEKVLRYRFVKHLRAYNDVLALVLRERGFEESADNLAPMHLFMECGAADAPVVSLISLGLSRVSALLLKRYVSFAHDATPEDCVAALRDVNVDALRIPLFSRRELIALGLGRHSNRALPGANKEG